MLKLKKIIPIPALKDNYIWLFYDEATAWVVDPGVASLVTHTLRQEGLRLAGILITHHHFDHSGGALELKRDWQDISIISSERSPFEWITHRVKDQDTITCDSFHFQVIEIPGHTLDHLAFFNNQVLFCGDTLFSAGCGRIFEGTPPMMYATLQKLMQLPDEIQIFCGHEYTLDNLLFAQVVLPQDALIQQKIKDVTRLRDQLVPTLPSTLGEEKRINPFLRCHTPEVKAAVENHVGKSLKNSIEVFAHLREWKNRH